MLQALDNDGLQEIYRDTLKAFYGVMKSMDGDIKFAFLTGVTKFGKVSVFSDLNNLDDISMKGPFASICGITEEELHEYFDEDIKALASSLSLTNEEVYAELKGCYDGYHLCRMVPVCIILSVCLIPLSICSLVATGLKQVHQPIW